MLGRPLPTGSQAISFHNTLFRVSELCWVKVEQLSIAEKVVKVLAFLCAVAWVFVVGEAKQNYYNLEFLLAVFPLVLAWTTSGSLRLGCSGDFEESYEQRRGIRSGLFTGWIEKLKSRESHWVHLKGTNYNLLLNMHRLAWIRPCFQWKLYPLFTLVIFGIYHALIGRNFDTEGLPFFDDFAILTFESGVGPVAALTKFVILLALVAFGLSIKRSVELCGTGGVQDTFQLSADHQRQLLDLFAGQPPAPVAPSTAPAESPPKTAPAGVSGKGKKAGKASPPAAKSQDDAAELEPKAEPVKATEPLTPKLAPEPQASEAPEASAQGADADPTTT